MVLTLCVCCSFLYPNLTFEYIEKVSVWIRDIFGQFYLILGFLIVVFMLVVGLLPIGRKRLGSSKPVYGFWSWVAMLYSAGMGAGILFRAVQEPVFMYLNSPLKTQTSADIMALEYTFFHWGFTAWGFYTVFALIIGHLIFNLKQPVQLSGLISKSSPGLLKVSLNGFTILATVIGIVSAIALGVKQIEDSAQLLIDFSDSFYVTILLIMIVFTFSTASSVLGLDKGIKQVSNVNIILTTLLLIFVFIQSDILEVLDRFISSFWQYIKDFIPMSLALGKYNPGKTFLTDWTYYYWAFWLAWAPFTGVFIARISRGRSYRQIVWGSLLVPSIASFFWFSVFGSSAIDMLNQDIVEPGKFNSAFDALSVFLQQFLWPSLSQIVVLILLFGFLITSLDSGIFVLSMFSDQGKQNPQNSHKILWAIFCLLLSLGFLYIGFILPENNVLSTVSKVLIIVSLPFAILSIVMIFNFIKQSLKS
ncbi:MAG: BCCT family transporter [Bacteroidetes bacterium]|nr:BCCT family transporter [Bacteroidota bacterium]